MIFFLSSGSRPRYLDDIIRAMALPAGALLTFRYEHKYLSGEMQKLFTTGNPKGMSGALCYIDQSTVGVAPQVVPCRMATIEAWENHGRSISIDFKLTGLPSIGDIPAFNTKLRQETSEIPSWSEKGLVGSWCLKSDKTDFNVVSWSDEDTWHCIADQLAGFAEFEKKDAFLRYLGIRTPSGAKHLPVTKHDDWYSLAPLTEYLLEIYHYHPRKVAEGKRLSIAVSDDSLLKVVSVSSKPLDSRYGLLRYRLVSAAPVASEKTALVMSFGTKDAAEIEYDAVITIARSWTRVAVRILSIGVFVAAPSLVAAGLADKLTWNVGIVMLILGFGAGAASTLVLPRNA